MLSTFSYTPIYPKCPLMLLFVLSLPLSSPWYWSMCLKDKIKCVTWSLVSVDVISELICPFISCKLQIYRFIQFFFKSLRLEVSHRYISYSWCTSCVTNFFTWTDKSQCKQWPCIGCVKADKGGRASGCIPLLSPWFANEELHSLTLSSVTFPPLRHTWCLSRSLFFHLQLLKFWKNAQPTVTTILSIEITPKGWIVAPLGYINWGHNRHESIGSFLSKPAGLHRAPLAEIDHVSKSFTIMWNRSVQIWVSKYICVGLCCILCL